MSKEIPSDLEIVQMRGQCNRVRLGLHPDDKYSMVLAYQHGLLVQEGARLVLTKLGDKFCTDLSGIIPT